MNELTLQFIKDVSTYLAVILGLFVPTPETRFFQLCSLRDCQHDTQEHFTAAQNDAERGQLHTPNISGIRFSTNLAPTAAMFLAWLLPMVIVCWLQVQEPRTLLGVSFAVSVLVGITEKPAVHEIHSLSDRRWKTILFFGIFHVAPFAHFQVLGPSSPLLGVFWVLLFHMLPRVHGLILEHLRAGQWRILLPVLGIVGLCLASISFTFLVWILGYSSREQHAWLTWLDSLGPDETPLSSVLVGFFVAHVGALLQTILYDLSPKGWTRKHPVSGRRSQGFESAAIEDSKAKELQSHRSAEAVTEEKGD